MAPFGMDGAQQLLRSTIDFAAHPQSSAALYTRLENLVAMIGICLPLSALGFWSLALREGRAQISEEGSATAGLYMTYAGAATLVLLLTSAKLGSASSYCLEVLAVLCVAIGLGISKLSRLAYLTQGQVRAALLLLAVAPLWVQIWNASKTAQATTAPGPDDSRLAALAQSERGPVLSLNGYILLHGAESPFLLDPLFFAVQERAGRWDSAVLTQMAEERRFISVVLFYPLEMAPTVEGIGWIPARTYAAIVNNYRLSGTAGRYFVYVPKEP
jgi:hypothetical protein